MANEAHLLELRKGVEAWNRWRDAHPDLRPDLSEAELSWPVSDAVPRFDGCNLRGALLNAERLDGLNLSAADASGLRVPASATIRNWTISRDTDLSRAHLADTTIENVRFETGLTEGMELVRAQISKAEFFFELRAVKLSRSALTDCRFTDVVLHGCQFQHALCHDCDFKGVTFVRDERDPDASLFGTQFQRCTMLDADFGDVDITQSFFSQCDLRRVKSIQFDDTYLIDTALSPYASDDWSTLARTYTGPKMVFNLIFLAIFFSPWVFEALSLNVLKGVQEAVIAEQTALRVTDAGESGAADPAAYVRGAVRNEMLAVLDRRLTPEASACLQGERVEHARCAAIWQVLIGAHEGVWTWGTSLLLLLYNAARLALTWLVAPLRDEQIRTGHTPARRWSPVDGQSRWRRLLTRYGWMMWPHKVINVLFFVAISASILNLVPRLLDRIWVPQ